MSDLRSNLRSEFLDEDYRYAYAKSFLNTKLAAQIRVLREQRGATQAELAERSETRQNGFSRYENVNHSIWKTDTLWKIARALGVRLNISFETFGSLIDEKEGFSRESLQRPDFEADPAFADKVQQGESSCSNESRSERITQLTGIFTGASFKGRYYTDRYAYEQAVRLDRARSSSPPPTAANGHSAEANIEITLTRHAPDL